MALEQPIPGSTTYSCQGTVKFLQIKVLDTVRLRRILLGRRVSFDLDTVFRLHPCPLNKAQKPNKKEQSKGAETIWDTILGGEMSLEVRVESSRYMIRGS